MIRNYNAYMYLILALFGHDGHCITFANVSLQFKRYYFNITQNLIVTTFTYFPMFNISTITIHTNIIIIQVIAISLNIILNSFFYVFHIDFRR